jgi:hypothetical protein
MLVPKFLRVTVGGVRAHAMAAWQAMAPDERDLM